MYKHLNEYRAIRDFILSNLYCTVITLIFVGIDQLFDIFSVVKRQVSEDTENC